MNTFQIKLMSDLYGRSSYSSHIGPFGEDYTSSKVEPAKLACPPNFNIILGGRDLQRIARTPAPCTRNFSLQDALLLQCKKLLWHPPKKGPCVSEIIWKTKTTSTFSVCPQTPTMSHNATWPLEDLNGTILNTTTLNGKFFFSVFLFLFSLVIRDRPF